MSTSAVIRESLKTVVLYARSKIHTDPDHAGYPNHRADERVRALLEEVLHDETLD